MYGYGPSGSNPFFNQSNQTKQANKQQGRHKDNQLSPNELAVIAALITKALTVQSILIDREQNIQILLEGSLKKRSELDRIIDEIRDVPIGDFISSLMNQK
ncbi:hypothetical protein [Alkalihalobacillus pseudalcaliphilus]|uniref:hypothetical protein n=1 Tax=Alkalihalobacillus pseudalcaliphilus TaxID=79884 RepID=UPI00064E0381|nr:hypothetical protein [Alkalihalobacillus pseudalcaliphilus]KMK74787.1 hypothetical protein AB990_20105 [Alkalihalobacillus pseudalcaliphilus]